MYRGGAVKIDDRGTVKGEGTDITGEADKSETSNEGRLEFGVSIVGKEVFEESCDIDTSSSSTSFPEDSVSIGDLALSRIRWRPRLSCLSRVNVRRRALRTGATGVVIDSGLCRDVSSSESLSSDASFVPCFGNRN
jgi:hypothetical protein